MIVGIKTDTGESVMSCKYPCPVERDSEGLPEKNEERKYEIKFSIPPTNKDGTCDTDCPLWRMTADTAGCALEYDDDACRPSGECPRKAQK
jgi:hypothetical protein